MLMVTPLPSLWRLTSAGLAESERTVTLLTAAECRDKAEQKMVEAANNLRPYYARLLTRLRCRYEEVGRPYMLSAMEYPD